MTIQREKEILGQDKFSNIELRIFSGVLIVALFVIAILWVPPLFYALMLIIAAGMIFEWHKMTKSSLPYLLLGFIIIPIPIISLMKVEAAGNAKFILLIYFITIWSVDTFAMIGGKNFKGPKLAPYLSPNKTWSGLIVGIAGAGLAASLISTIPVFASSSYYLFDKNHIVLSCMFIAALAQMSDLFISYFKRKFNIKDSGNLIPGHGGILDRFDSIILTAPVLFLSVCIL